jgi:methionyl aminopeptidase
MITLKSERELALMREAGHIVALAHKAVKDAIRPGISTAELDKIAYDVITSNGAIPSFLNYNGFPATICASVNEVVIHGIPSKNTILKDGDIISVDIGANYKGYHGDCAKTFFVGSVSEEKRQLVEVTTQSLYEGLKFARPGNRLSDISHAIEEYARSFGYSVVLEYTGHGVGHALHEDPAVPNYGAAGRGPILKKGMTLAIEPMINMGTHRIKVLKDNWTVVTQDKKPSAHYEHSIVITDDGYEILTKIKGEEIDV